MICKRCKTAVSDNSKACAVCDRPVRNSAVKWKFLAAVLTFSAAVSIFVFGGSGESVSYDEANGYYETRGGGLSLGLLPSEAGGGPPVPEIPMPVSHANLDMPILEVWAMIDEISRLINLYHDNFSDTVTFLSRNGHLFDLPAGAYVLISELEGLFDVDDRFLEESIMFFYFRPVDLLRFRNLSVSGRDELVIFTGFETREGFAITGRGEQGGIITREDLRELLDMYSWNHGSPGKVERNSDVFELSVRALAAYTGNNSGFDVRYMYGDDRFIAVVASPVNDPLNIGMFILEYLEGAVFVRLSGIEEAENLRVAVNSALPNFNQDLLPPYDLRSMLRELREDFGDIIDTLLLDGHITEAHLPPRFMSGTSDFVYIEFEPGMIFLGGRMGDNWIIYPVEDYSAAHELLSSLSRRPPLFIVRQG